MVKEELKKNFWIKMLAAVFLATASFAYSILKITDIKGLTELMQVGAPLAKKDFFSSSFFLKVPSLPVFVVWFFIGIFIYFLYFSLASVYSDIANRVIVQTTYANTEADENSFKLSRLNRIFLHLLVIVYYLVAAFVTFFFTIPASETIRNYSQQLLTPYTQGDINFYLSFISSILFWILMLNIFTLLLDVLFSFIFKEEFEEEHFATEE